MDAATTGNEVQAQDADVKAINELQETYKNIKAELAKVIVGQDEVIEQLMLCFFARGHALLEGVPGLAKTLLIQTISDAMTLHFSRIQFTPDLMPADITGTYLLQENDTAGRREFQFEKGPIFANIVLADEINRTPPKTQAALLQAMQEHSVSAGNELMKLPQPFFVLATQNPIEQEGTYPLPEAQLDRFMFLINVDYPSVEEEIQIARQTTGEAAAAVTEQLSGEKILEYQDLVRRVPVPDHIYSHVVRIVRMTRPKEESTPDWIKQWVSWGAGPRAVQYIILGAKARAVLQGSYLVRAEDVEAVAVPVLLHRILTNFRADSEGMTSEAIIKRILDETRED